MACFFGFGSLVNASTHRYEMVAPAQVNGWARAWIDHDLYQHALLSVIPETDTRIHGLMARVPDNNWAELDKRELGYQRYVLNHEEWSAGTILQPLDDSDIQMYKHTDGSFATPDKPILWSYLETVLHGYYQVFGSTGVEAFISTTRHWTVVSDDRDAPLYPRYRPAVGDAAKAVVLPVMYSLLKRHSVT
uniref:Gamma-glutamylcyclotransferase n=1 Tax=uncultured Thiotrichaceae bacterium TaxID=298394 RepID=A0A6S6SJR1_9GAMM|nr:MAG: Gamma-glutamylcyclotransferase [uncultured Thiotrichaceae bacterium]